MKKVVKIILVTLGVIVLIPVLLLLTLPLWLGPVVKPTVNTLVPHYTKTSFKLGHLYANPYTMRFELGDLELGNPEGFKEEYAVKLGGINVDVETGSLFGDCIIVEEVVLDDFFVSLVSNAEGKGNFQVISENASSTKKADDREAAKAEGKSVDQVKVDQVKTDKKTDPKAGQTAEKKPAKQQKIIIDRILVRNVRLKTGLMTIPAPSIEIKNLGRDSGGYDLNALGPALVKEFFASIAATGVDLKNLSFEGFDAAMKSTKAATDAAMKSTKAATDAAMKSVTSGSSTAMKAVGDTTGKAVDAATKSASKAVDSVTEGAGKAVDSLKGLFK